MLDWNDLQYLLALSQQQTLPAAAEQLGVNRTTVARRIEQLEKHLGAKLVEKIGRDLVLTDAGREAVAAAQQMEGELHNLERQVFGRDQELAGMIRLTTPPGIACMLAPYFKSFQDQYPEISLQISATNATEDLELLESDVALRLTEHPKENLAGKMIARPKTAIYTSPEIARNLHRLTSIDYIRSPVMDRVQQTLDGIELNRVMSTNSMDLIKEMIACGKGAGSIPCYLAEDDNRLVRISEPVLDYLPQLWILYHPRLRSQLRIRRFVDHLEKSFDELKSRFEAV